MHSEEDNKTFYGYDDWVTDLHIINRILKKYPVMNLHAVYIGSLFYTQNVFKVMNEEHLISLNIIKYQRYDGDDDNEIPEGPIVHLLDEHYKTGAIEPTYVILDDIIDSGETMVECITAIIDKYDILPDDYDKIVVIGLYSKSEGIGVVKEKYPDANVIGLRDATDLGWIDFFTEIDPNTYKVEEK